MKALGYIWGIGGVILLLLFAIYRLAPMAFELRGIELTLLHWSCLVFSIVYMAYAEGYKGFHKGFSPRVVRRAHHLAQHPQPLHLILAPAFCMSYFHTTRKRQIVSFGLTFMIICFVIIARQLPQPWRGILDAGVVVGLSLGVMSLLYFVFLQATTPEANTMSPELPSDTPVANPS